MWTVEDVAEVLQVSPGRARQLLAEPGAPPRLQMRSQRCDRWSGWLIMAWVSGIDWRSIADSWSSTPPAPYRIDLGNESHCDSPIVEPPARRRPAGKRAVGRAA